MTHCQCKWKFCLMTSYQLQHISSIQETENRSQNWSLWHYTLNQRRNRRGCRRADALCAAALQVQQNWSAPKFAHNHVCQILEWNFEVLWFYRGSKFLFSYWFLNGHYNSAALLCCLWYMQNSVHFMRMGWDFAFLSNIVCGLLFSGTQCKFVFNYNFYL